MIPLMLDESVAFDMLSILYVKIQNGLPSGGEAASIYRQIRIALGVELTTDVLNSPEFRELRNANERVFDCVGKAKNNEITAKEVDLANHKRFLAKRALQSKFWPASPLRETKTER